MPVNRRFRASRPVQRRKLVWGRYTQTPSLVIPATTSALIPLLSTFQTQLGSDMIGCTVRRIRANLSLRGGVAGNSVRATMGIGVFPNNSTAAIIGPQANQHLDWMFWRLFYYEPPVATEFATLNGLDIDVKAQRKVEELQDELILIITNNHPTDGLAYALGASTLVALP